MSRRSLVSASLVLAGLVLLGLAGLHYLRGYQAQTAGKRAWEESRITTVAFRPAASSPPQSPAAPAPSPPPRPASAKEDPGIAASLPPPAANEKPYPYGRPVARLRIPSAEIDNIVFGGADQAVLEKGPGHIPGSELPGEETGRKNCVITAHRDSHFRHLGWLRKGHRIELETPDGGQTSYRVVSREIVKPDTVRVLQPTPKPRLTLITCYPFNYVGAAPKRLVVVAEPIPSRHPS